MNVHMFQPCYFVDLVVCFVTRSVLCAPISLVTQRTQSMAQSPQSFLQVVMHDGY